MTSTNGTGDTSATGHGAHYERLRALTCAKWTWHDEDVIPAWVADMDLAPVPAAVAAVRALADRGDFGYNMAAVSRIPEAFSDWERSRHGWCPDPKRVRVFCDVMQAVDAALYVHTSPGDGVILFTPIYPPFLKSATVAGRRIVDCPLHPDGWRLDPELLEAVVDDRTTAILLCDPHNPTGRAFTREDLEAIADVATRHDLLVVSDEIWGDLVHPGHVHMPIASLGDEIAERTVTICAASKAFNLAGLSCAVAHLGSRAVFDALKALPGHLLGAVGSPGAEATLAAWTAGGPWLDATRAFLTERRDQLAARLAADLPEVRWSPPEATYLAWLDFRGLGLAGDPAKEILARGRVALSPGPDFGTHGEGFARLNFATSPAILDDIVDGVVAAVRTL